MSGFMMRVAVARWELAYQLRKRRERLLLWFVWKLPRTVVMWCAIRVFAHATQGQWSHQNVPELTAMDALKRWEKP